MPRVFLHIDVLSWLRGASRGEPRQRGKCLDHLRQLLATGETPFKLTAQGPNKGWRRSQLFGNRFYLWWAPCGTMRQIVERMASSRANLLTCDPGDAFVRTITYHDKTDIPVMPDAHRPELWTELTPALFDELGASNNRPTRSGPRTGRGRFGAGESSGLALDVRAARKQRKLARRAARAGLPLAPASGQVLLEQPRCACGEVAVKKLIGAEAGPYTHCDKCFVERERAVELRAIPNEIQIAEPAHKSSVLTTQVPAEVQQALLDLYGSKLSQKEAARRIGISQPTFNQWVSGRRGISKRYWPKILNAAATLRPQSPPPGSRKRHQKADKPVMPSEVQDALLDLLTSKVVARAEIARRIGVSSQTLAQWVNGGAVAEFYWPLIVIVANKVRAEQREADEFARALGVLGERHGAENLPKLIGVRRETLADYYKYGVLPARAKVLKAIELAK